MKYLRVFETHSDYIDYEDSNDFLTPNVSACLNGVNHHVHYNKKANPFLRRYIAIDDLPQDRDEENDVPIPYQYEVSESDYLLNYYLPQDRNPSFSNVFEYVGVYEYNSTKYYLWQQLPDKNQPDSTGLGYILTYNKTFEGLTIKDNVNNRYCPIFATLNNDMTIHYTHEDISDSIIFDEWTVDYSQQYLTTEALENGNIVFKLGESGDTDQIESISYSTNNGETWTTIQNQDNKNSEIEITLSVNKGDKVLWRGNNVNEYGILNSGEGAYGWFDFHIECNVYGNVMSLMYGDDFVNQTTLKGSLGWLFPFCSVVDASKLVLPATTMAEYCYASMFYGCADLTTAPVLPATTLADGCYIGMFYYCSSLTTAPELPATTLAENCYNDMFDGCTSLTTAPVLPATTLASSCYIYMFKGCTSLNYIKAMFTTTPSNTYTENWVQNVAASGTFVKNASATWTTTGVNGVPSGWTVQTASE